MTGWEQPATGKPSSVWIWYDTHHIGITGIFIVSIVLGHAHRFRWSALMLVLGLLVSAAACICDFKNNRYQATGGGTGATYFIWWWYYEPFWHGYEPGNI